MMQKLKCTGLLALMLTLGACAYDTRQEFDAKASFITKTYDVGYENLYACFLSSGPVTGLQGNSYITKDEAYFGYADGYRIYFKPLSAQRTEARIGTRFLVSPARFEDAVGDCASRYSKK